MTAAAWYLALILANHAGSVTPTDYSGRELVVIHSDADYETLDLLGGRWRLIDSHRGRLTVVYPAAR